MDAKQIIEAAGGGTEVARLLGVTKGAVSQWYKANHIPTSRLAALMIVRPRIFEKQKAA